MFVDNNLKYLTIKSRFEKFTLTIIYSAKHQLLTDRSDAAENFVTLGSRNNNHKVNLTSAKKSRKLENSNSQKRRVINQARLMKVKNFPPCFIKDNTNFDSNYLEYNRKKSYSVDRVESRRQKRINKSTKNSIASISKLNNPQPKRTMSESRKDKRMFLRERNQNMAPPFFLNNEA